MPRKCNPSPEIPTNQILQAMLCELKKISSTGLNTAEVQPVTMETVTGYVTVNINGSPVKLAVLT